MSKNMSPDVTASQPALALQILDLPTAPNPFSGPILLVLLNSPEPLPSPISNVVLTREKELCRYGGIEAVRTIWKEKTLEIPKEIIKI